MEKIPLISLKPNFTPDTLGGGLKLESETCDI